LFHKAGKDIINLAAVCRQIYVSKSINVGIGTLRTSFGKKKRRGVQPPKHTKASAKILREVVGQLKKNGYIENYANESGNTFGLVLTRQGRAELDKIATRIIKDLQPKA
jgi:small subunit ribosomal protein S19e